MSDARVTLLFGKSELEEYAGLVSPLKNGGCNLAIHGDCRKKRK